ncbi:dTDP-4-dehydrorhamnose 3,5-epimerase family protein [Clostridium felsineum]|uniref:dTDP-4-dehydrorhamnose 3,5-epimerase family protein n=1 Tax=Clostridium felsineum TaxID=36839 RepID=UPI002AFE03F8|nr:dTDP-4-dehydrorhamnose 3,5-epimerase family protein [Clostridium felsineum]
MYILIKKGTLSGIHFQKTYKKVKIVSCTKGSIYDVIADITKDSKTYMKCFFVELSNENRKMLYISKGFAHEFHALEDNTEVFYRMPEFYHTECGCGIG